MAEYCLDTGVLIQCLRGQADALVLWDTVVTAGQVHISAVTYVEVIAGMHPAEEDVTYDLLTSCLCHPLDHIIADRAGHLIARHRAQGIALGVADAIIAATALLFDLTLVTYNRKHFPMPELSIYPV